MGRREEGRVPGTRLGLGPFDVDLPSIWCRRKLVTLGQLEKGGGQG